MPKGIGNKKFMDGNQEKFTNCSKSAESKSQWKVLEIECSEQYQELALVPRLRRPRHEGLNKLREFGINSPVSSVEGMSISFHDSLWGEVDRSNKDGTTVYQKRSQAQFRKDEYAWWSLPSGGV